MKAFLEYVCEISNTSTALIKYKVEKGFGDTIWVYIENDCLGLYSTSRKKYPVTNYSSKFQWYYHKKITQELRFT